MDSDDSEMQFSNDSPSLMYEVFVQYSDVRYEKWKYMSYVESFTSSTDSKT